MGTAGMPVADKGAPGGEAARRWLRGCRPGCHGFRAMDFVLVGPFIAQERREGGFGAQGAASVPELPPRGGCAGLKGQRMMSLCWGHSPRTQTLIFLPPWRWFSFFSFLFIYFFFPSPSPMVGVYEHISPCDISRMLLSNWTRMGTRQCQSSQLTTRPC